MRHSRRRVMREHYEIYMKKHIFNGRYFARNMQLVLCLVLVVTMTISCITVGSSLVKSGTMDNVDIHAALFETEKKTDTKKSEETKEDSEKVEVAANVTETEEIQEPVNVYAMAEAQPEEEKEPSLFDDRCIANVEDELNIRENPDSESEFVGSMESGAIAIVEGTEGEWTKIKSGEVEGYVLTKYILTGSVAESFAKDYVILQGTVLEDGVNIRSEKSTTADIVTILDKDAKVTVLEDPTAEEELSPHVVSVDDTEEEVAEETATDSSEDDVVWMTVRLEDGQEGYVSADYINIDELYQIAVSKEELERRAAEEEAARKAAEEEAARKAAAAAAASSSSHASNSYPGYSYNPIVAAQSGDLIGTFTLTAYCNCPQCCNGSLTATGTVPTPGRTIAADTSILPFGTQVVIGGIVYTVEDTGGGVKGNHIDIFFGSHAEAIAFGRKSMPVYRY